MADYTWTGAIDGDLDKPGNYTVGGAVATAVPGAQDTLTVDCTDTYPTTDISSGTLYATMSFIGTGMDGFIYWQSA